MSENNLISKCIYNNRDQGHRGDAPIGQIIVAVLRNVI